MQRFYGTILLALVLLTGCNQQDRDSLSKVGRKLIENIEDAAGTSSDPLASGIQAVRGSAAASHIDGRVVLRLRWERELDGCTIRVRATGPTTVQLEGCLKEEAQRSRAIEVAKATSGVETVEDRLKVKEPPGEKVFPPVPMDGMP
jgi:osmotically-inducible protein OsmY